MTARNSEITREDPGGMASFHFRRAPPSTLAAPMVQRASRPLNYPINILPIRMIKMRCPDGCGAIKRPPPRLLPKKLVNSFRPLLSASGTDVLWLAPPGQPAAHRRAERYAPRTFSSDARSVQMHLAGLTTTRCPSQKNFHPCRYAFNPAEFQYSSAIANRSHRSF